MFVLQPKQSRAVCVYNRREKQDELSLSWMNLLYLKQSRLVHVVCLLVAASCVSPVTGGMWAQQPENAPSVTTKQPIPQTPTPTISSPGASVDTKTFKVGPQDILKVIVWREQDFSGLYTVHSDGKITLPLVGDIQAGGLTAEEIQKNVVGALSKLIQKPNVTVTVQQVLSQRYYMDGGVGRPGEYQLSAPTTVLEALSIAGGLREFANGKKIYILRGSERIRFNYKDVIKGKNLDQNIQLQPGDHVIVPE
jgi:polysaccharide biosynthesis/export protein